MHSVERYLDWTLVQSIGEPIMPTNPRSFEVRFDCPFCENKGKGPDTDGHLHINPLVEKFICYRCTTMGDFDRLYSLVGLHPGEIGVTQWDRVVSALWSGEAIVEPKDKPYNLALEPSVEYVPVVPPDTQAYTYLRDRGLTDEDIQRFRLGVGLRADAERDYSNRIIIPDVRQDGTWAFWQGRGYMPRSYPKYLNPLYAASDVVYRSDWVAGLDYVVVCEGTISAMAWGAHGLAIYGKYASADQITVLSHLDANTIFVCLDPDAKTNALRLARALYELGKDVRFIDMPMGKDPGDYLLDRPALYRFLETALPFNPMNELVIGLG